jgi:hypothetical protein
MFQMLHSLPVLIVAIGVLLLLCSILPVKVSKPNARLSIPGIISCVLGALWLWHVAVSAPGGEDTIDQRQPDHPDRPSPGTPVERLKMPWDSEGDPYWPAAKVLATLSLRAYLPPVDAEDSFVDLGFRNMKTIVHSSMLGYVVTADDTAVIVFRGTDDVPDWFANLDGRSTLVEQGSIHTGFYDAYHALKAQVMKLLEKAKAKHIWITGHSLGGAVALVCAYDLMVNEHRDIDGIMTFGQPMVADPALARHLDRARITPHCQGG